MAAFLWLGIDEGRSSRLLRVEKKAAVGSGSKKKRQ